MTNHSTKTSHIIRTVTILGTGSYVPEQIVTNEELARTVDTSDRWIKEKLGISERRIASVNQATSHLASEAALRALRAAGITPAEVELIIVATATPDRPIPATACIVQATLGAWNAAAFDLSAVCSGFLYALSVGAHLIEAGAYRNVLLIGADTFSRITNWQDRSCVFFGDGAGAVLLGKRDDEGGRWAIDLYADGRGVANFTIPAGGSAFPTSAATVTEGLNTFRMNGHAVFSAATTLLPAAIQKVLLRWAAKPDEVDVLIPHQPSINILKLTAERIGIPFERILTNMDRYGNTAGASVPLLLDEANRSGKLRQDALVVLAAVGAGWTWAAAALRWDVAPSGT